MKNQDELHQEVEKALDDEKRTRRKFLQTVGKTAATAPAVAMLLAASAVPARAQTTYGGGGVI